LILGSYAVWMMDSEPNKSTNEPFAIIARMFKDQSGAWLKISCWTLTSHRMSRKQKHPRRVFRCERGEIRTLNQRLRRKPGLRFFCRTLSPTGIYISFLSFFPVFWRFFRLYITACPICPTSANVSGILLAYLLRSYNVPESVSSNASHRVCPD
jgi:hypothetical protein